jgi:hypothetical protein
MLTILAFMIFVGALLWNTIFFCIAFSEIINGRKISWKNKTNLLHASLSLAILFIPGVYLFGWF